MESPILLITAIESGLGFLLSSAILWLVLARGRKAYHYLFAGFLLICVIWDAGVFVLMLRNEHLEELPIIGRVAITPCILIPALLFHFANLYSGRPGRWGITGIWIATAISMVLVFAGVFYQIEGVHSYSWGNIFRVAPSFMDPGVFIFWFGINLWACWFVFKAAGRAESPLERRHYRYVLAGMLAITFAVLKALVTMGVDAGVLLPLGMFFNDTFSAVIGVAIIKERLFDITVIVKRGTVYSLLVGVLIFVYSLSEHLLVTYASELIGGYSQVAHIVSIAAGIAVLMPLKRRLEGAIEGYFQQKRLEF